MENTTTVVDNPYGLQALWAQGDFVARGTLIILVLMSLFSWYIILIKVWDQRKLMQSAKTAEQKFWTASSIKDAIERLPKGDPFRNIAEDGLRATSHHEGRLTDRIDFHEWVTMSLQRSSEAVNNHLQSGLAVLATVGSTAPFVGLFGTVWGIYHALAALGADATVAPSLSQVAGPVGEALVMTAAGLAVAIPAVLGYNAFGQRIASCEAELEGFAHDLRAWRTGSGPSAPAAAAGDRRSDADGDQPQVG
jgi:biopolymer transport protein ExbB